MHLAPVWRERGCLGGHGEELTAILAAAKPTGTTEQRVQAWAVTDLMATKPDDKSDALFQVPDA
jgi:hypothetical protein